MILALAAMVDAHADSLWDDDAPALFNNRKAAAIGDVVTILIVESSSGYNRQSARAREEDEVGFSGQGIGPLDFIDLFGADFESRSDYSGLSNTSVSGGLNARISAEIVEVLPNGQLRLAGQRTLILNDEHETIRVTGNVRADDICSDNTVLSIHIANAEIEREGTGPSTSSAKRGLLSRIFSWLF
jgi:flagellar L-ring protein precursor FlgH